MGFTRAVIELTDGLGADVIIDAGPGERLGVSKHDILMSLASCGRWITQCRDLQVIYMYMYACMYV